MADFRTSQPVLAVETDESRWVQVAKSPNFVAYLDTQSLRKEGSVVKFWVRKEFLSPPDTKIKSEPERQEHRVLALFYDNLVRL